MKTNEIQTPETGQVSAQATEPKDNESEFQKQRFQNCVDKIQEAVSSYPVEWRPKVLAAALEHAMKGKGATEKLVVMEDQVRSVCDKLDVKTRAVFAILGELSSVAGISNDVGSYGTDLLNSTYQGKALVDEALQQYPDDSDLAFLTEVYELAHSINKAKSEHDPWKETAEEETATKEPQAIEDAQPQATEPEDTEAGPNTGIKALDGFLEGLSLEAKAAAHGALSLVCVSEGTGNKMRDYLQKEVAIFDDPEYAEKQTCMDSQIYSECTWFLGFVQGAQIGNYEA